MRLLSDVRCAFRALRKRPGLVVAAVCAFGLGIGASTAVFSVASAFLLKPFPFRELGRMVAVMEVRRGQSDDWSGVAPANFVDWRQQARSFERLAAFEWAEVNLTGAGEPEKRTVALISVDFFVAVGVRPLRGRVVLAEDEQPGRDRVVVLSQTLWETRFAADLDVIGRTVQIDGRAVSVIGVMPRQFLFPMGAELWMPLALTPEALQHRESRRLQVFGLLRPGVPIDEARAEMRTIARRLASVHPEANHGWSVTLSPLSETAVGDLTRQYTFLLLGAMGLVLLIACANVANLQFARAPGRARELAIRLATGVRRWDIVRQLLVKSVLLSLLGCVAGLLLGAWAIGVIVTNMPAEVARWIAGWSEIRLDLGVLAGTVAVAALAGLIAGLAPALHASRPDLSEALKEGSRSLSGGRERQRARNTLVVVEMALALVLLASAMLTSKGLRTLIDQNRGFEPGTLLTMAVNLPDSRYAQPHQQAACDFRTLHIPVLREREFGDSAGAWAMISCRSRTSAVGMKRLIARS